MSTQTFPALVAGMRVRIEKGCRARDVHKGTTASILAVELLGADYSHQVRVRLAFNQRVISFYARHPNRLHDATVGMNDGNPMHRIEVRRS